LSTGIVEIDAEVRLPDLRDIGWPISSRRAPIIFHHRRPSMRDDSPLSERSWSDPGMLEPMLPSPWPDALEPALIPDLFVATPKPASRSTRKPAKPKAKKKAGKKKTGARKIAGKKRGVQKKPAKRRR
jgi:hypothetical protein